MNYYVLAVFAPLLIIVGLLGFIVPANKSLTSGAPAYNIFHLVFGLVGVAILLFGNTSFVRAFNIGFGLIDLYQAVGSFLHFFPEQLFKWKRADDVLHIVIGAGLVMVGLVGG